MKAHIQPSILQGSATAPPSKSCMQRACALGLLAKGKTHLQNIGISNDDKAALNIISSMGAELSYAPNGRSMTIESKGIHPTTDIISCGESGLGMRMFTPIVSLSEKKITIEGIGSLTQRPMTEFEKVLPQLGVGITSNEGKVPITVQGPLQAKNVRLDGSLSSQYLTGILLAYAYLKNPQAKIEVVNLQSKPYIDLTLAMLKSFGVEMQNDNYTFFQYKSGELKGTDYIVESDWSGGAFLLAAGATLGKVLVKGLQIDSTQADKKMMEVLEKAGAKMQVKTEGIEVEKSVLSSFDFDATECPDLFPPLVVLASAAQGISKLTGVQRLLHKESNRAFSLQTEMQKLGVQVELNDNDMLVHGTQNIRASQDLHSHHDHRIAMANTLVALRASNGATSVLDEAGAIGKSYTMFYEDLKNMNANLTIT